MAIWTYVKNADPKSKVKVILLRNGTLQLRIETYADLTEQEVDYIFDSSGGFVLEEGIIVPATPAQGGGGELPKALFLTVWTPNTHQSENQLIVSPEGEFLRVLRDFKTGETYVF